MDATFTLTLRVDDKRALHAAALAHGKCVDGLDDDETLALIGTEDAPDIAACLTMLLDPGSLLGATIEASSVDLRDDLAG